jgi:hypothetical protein
MRALVVPASVRFPLRGTGVSGRGPRPPGTPAFPAAVLLWRPAEEPAADSFVALVAARLGALTLPRGGLYCG